jgi:hypothetical protein
MRKLPFAQDPAEKRYIVQNAVPAPGIWFGIVKQGSQSEGGEQANCSSSDF